MGERRLRLLCAVAVVAGALYTDRSAPVQVSTAATGTDRTLWAWGYNGNEWRRHW